jgi:hypothetical protein
MRPESQHEHRGEPFEFRDLTLLALSLPGLGGVFGHLDHWLSALAMMARHTRCASLPAIQSPCWVAAPQRAQRRRAGSCESGSRSH